MSCLVYIIGNHWYTSSINYDINGGELTLEELDTQLRRGKDTPFFFFKNVYHPNISEECKRRLATTGKKTFGNSEIFTHVIIGIINQTKKILYQIYIPFPYEKDVTLFDMPQDGVFPGLFSIKEAHEMQVSQASISFYRNVYTEDEEYKIEPLP